MVCETLKLAEVIQIYKSDKNNINSTNLFLFDPHFIKF